MVLKVGTRDREKPPLCKDLGEWRKGAVGTGGLGTQARRLTLILRGGQRLRRLGVGDIHDNPLKARSRIRLSAAPRTVARLLCPRGFSR